MPSLEGQQSERAEGQPEENLQGRRRNKGTHPNKRRSPKVKGESKSTSEKSNATDEHKNSVHNLPHCRSKNVVLPHSDLLDEIPPLIEENYCAAGILPFCKRDNLSLVLLGKEVRGKELSWSDFGGKREAMDKKVQDTAIREFMEETGGLYLDCKDTFVENLNRSALKKIWNVGGKYVLFLLEVPYRNNFDGLSADSKVELKWFSIQELSWSYNKQHCKNNTGTTTKNITDVDHPNKDEDNSLNNYDNNDGKEDITLSRFFGSTLRIKDVMVMLSNI